jgi:hypothetical protein
MLMNTKNKRNSKKQISGIKRKLSRKSRLNMVGGMTLHFFVRTINQIVNLEVEPSDTIEAVKGVLQNHIGLSPDDQRLIFNGKTLEDGRMLADYNIPDNATIYLVERPRRCPQCLFDEQIASLREEPIYAETDVLHNSYTKDAK